MTDEDYSLTVEEAMERLEVTPDYDCGHGPEDCVHTFRQAGPMLLGAHWSLDDARASIENYGATEAGAAATTMHHGIVIIDDNGPVFLATKAPDD